MIFYIKLTTGCAIQLEDEDSYPVELDNCGFENYFKNHKVKQQSFISL